MKRFLPALLLAAFALLGTASCSDDLDNGGSGDSNPPATDEQVPAPVPT